MYQLIILITLLFNGANANLFTSEDLCPQINLLRVETVVSQDTVRQIPYNSLGKQFDSPLTHSYMDSSLDLYLLIGQSNMAGRGKITGSFATQQSQQVLMLTKNNQWIPAHHPLHFDKPSVAGVGPGLAFGVLMAGADPSHIVGLIPCAVGGTSINTWVPGGYDSATKTHPYDDMLIRLKEVQKSGALKGVIWLQGESDSSPDKAADYLQKLEALIQRLRMEANNKQLPFVAGELGRFKSQYATINKQLKKLPHSISYVAVASSNALKDKGDQTHFDSPSAEKMGKRMAKKMKRLQSQL